MTEIRFYHLQTQPLEKALPQILLKALSGGHRMVVKTKDEARAETLCEELWTFHPQQFLPHGTKKDGHEADQPVFLTEKDENPNGADVLILTEGVTAEKPEDYSLCCEIFDGRDETMVTSARARWKKYKDAGFEVTYWKQNEQGGWDKK